MTGREALDSIRDYLENDVNSDLGTYAFFEELNALKKDLEELEKIKNSINDMVNEIRPKIEELFKLHGEEWFEHKDECVRLVGQNAILTELLELTKGADADDK